MGTYETDYWLTDTWGMNRRESRSGVYHPYRPDAIAHRAFSLTGPAVSAVSRAELSIAKLNADTGRLTDTEPLARLILRSEALASSRIEGLEMPAGRLLEFEALSELGVPHRTDSTEAAVVSNIAAMQEAVGQIAALPQITLEAICSINRCLLRDTLVAERAGKLRTEQNWIGGNRINPIGAAYVPPRPSLVHSLMDDLVEFCNASDYPPVVVAALAHAQLETVHPFVDGNGRTGRALIHVILKRGGLAPRTVPPISLVLATDRERYINNLAAFRTDEKDNPTLTFDEAASNWVEYFANACVIACDRALDFETALNNIRRSWRKTVRPRANSTADLLLDVLLSAPVVSIKSAARLTGRSDEAARQALTSLQASGIVRQNAKNRKSNIFVARDILDAFTAYERALAVPGGDTASEKVVRPVPQRARRDQ